MDYAIIAAELIKALRGRRSCADFSRRAGYRSNIAQRWEAQHSWPTAARFLQVRQRVRPQAASWLASYFHGEPEFIAANDPNSPAAVAAFLRWLKGKTPIVKIAEHSGYNRYTLARWFEGTAEPRLPDFLRLVDVVGRRLLDLLAAIEDPARLPSVAKSWARLELARDFAYTQPLSHAVLRALELDSNPRTLTKQHVFIAQRLNLASQDVERALRRLLDTGQIRKTRSGLRPAQVMAVATSHDPARSRALKLTWTQTALERLQRGAAGSFGYSLFAISKADLTKLEEIHLQYVRAMQTVIASSKPNECVALYCSQLIDLSARGPGDPKPPGG